MIYTKRKSGAYVPPPGSVYVGRPTRWGNPYNLENYTSEEVKVLYREYLSSKDKSYTNPLRRKKLVCWCKDKPNSLTYCHSEDLFTRANGLAHNPWEIGRLMVSQGSTIHQAEEYVLNTLKAIHQEWKEEKKWLK